MGSTSDGSLTGGEFQNKDFAGRLQDRDLKVAIAPGAAKRQLDDFAVSQAPLKLVLDLLEGFIVALAPGVRAAFLGGGAAGAKDDKKQGGAKMLHGSFWIDGSTESRFSLN
jgi:hypothetical protein